jgi:hypothetical protein
VVVEVIGRPTKENAMKYKMYFWEIGSDGVRAQVSDERLQKAAEDPQCENAKECIAEVTRRAEVRIAIRANRERCSAPL